LNNNVIYWPSMCKWGLWEVLLTKPAMVPLTAINYHAV